jgi:GT2 family glycosyltransferase
MPKQHIASKGSITTLSIILLNFNGWNWVEKCLHSFHHLDNWASTGPEGFEVILVDNGSTENKLAVFEERYPWLITKRLPENIGFSAGNNVGISMAKSPFVMLLNTDTEFTPKTNLSLLLEQFNNPSVAIVSPKVVLSSGDIDHACHRGFPTPWNALMYYSGIARRFPRWPLVSGYTRSWQDLQTIHPVDACTGAAMIVRTAAIDQVGLLDESFFMYAEDIDWCYRFAQAGWLTMYDPSVVVIHHKHKSGQKNQDLSVRSKSITAFFNTMKQFMNKHYRHKYPAVVLFVSFVMIDILKAWKLHNERKQYADE